ncbi:MAG: hypothetical protein DMF61_01810 [Blastocatellia bacterium AA13]|nr:MAG: hypothetical protein DMF61_01810 [Blastocatellia bacterium AA13]
MASFQLKKGADVFDCDVFGPVKKNGNQIGAWTTSKDNKIVINQTNGSPLTFDVTWKFNSDNHLCLSSGGNQIIDFHNVGNRPVCGARTAVLLTKPDKGAAFTFELRGEWDLDENHNLSFTINGAKSTLDGFIDDPLGGFVYHFRNKKDITQESLLAFVGKWQVNNSGAAAGALIMDFVYSREDGSEDKFTLPKSMIINRANNQLLYQYDKNNETFNIQIAGLLKISKDFEITYTIDRQVSGSGAERLTSTTFTLGAVFNKPNLSGDLELTIKKTDGTAGSTTLTIGGNFTAMLGANQLQVGYSFSQIRSGNTINTVFAFNGTLNIAHNGQVQFTFEKSASSQLSVSISAENIQLGSARANAALNLKTQDGKVVGIFGLFGVSF